MERLPFTRSHWRVAALLGTGTFFDAFDSLVIASALTVILITLHIDFVHAGTIISAAYLGQFVGAIVFGRLSETRGRRVAFLLSVAIFGLFSVVTAAVWNYESLLVFRFLQGIGLGAEVPVAGALFSEFVRGRTRGRVVMLYESLFAWGILLAPVVAIGLFAAVGNTLGWRLLFLVGGLPMVVAVVGYFKLPESPRWLAQHGRTSEADSVVTRLEEEAVASGQELPDIEVRPSGPVVATRFRELFSTRYRRRTALTWVQWFCSYFVTYGYTVWLPTLYVKVGGLSVTHSLALTIVTSAIGLASTYTFALTVDRVGRKPYFTSGFLLGVAGAVLGIVLTATTSDRGVWVPLFVASILLQIGIGWSNVGVYLYTPELFPTRMRAWATAAGSSMNRIASIIAPIVVGAILGAGLGVTSVFALFGAVAAVGGVVMATIGVETKGRTLEELSP